MRPILELITIPLYITQVKLSEKRRATHYKKGSKKKIPKKYEKYVFNKKGILVHPKTGTPAIANPRSVGTPRYKKINGQEIYSGMPHHMRAKIVLAIKKNFLKYLKEVKPIQDFPIQIDMELHAEIGIGNWDLDNLWIYNKCFQDALTEAGIIPEDNIQYITKCAAPEFVPVASEEQRKFVFKIYKDNRQEIISNPYWEGVAPEDW
ncbi:hypothetical protein PP178_04110 [Zeaxanthinibacter sp. PT1]|uniref:hypothetical protein n=1 Tax=Zeaxanthinibacter TaxID=561554 RepID=UPI00234AE1BF|nr:hypothetical protein [Zeaxanthinibacter sp. PT1]MDC6350725.1 hypothetical protein [Zeaxanthinibacter sp. PT1]